MNPDEELIKKFDKLRNNDEYVSITELQKYESLIPYDWFLSDYEI